MDMGCPSCRELLSADLDGEADPSADLSVAHAHLAECPDCARWYASAAEINRLLRTELAEPAPGLDEDRMAQVLAELPKPPSARRRVLHVAARWALAGVGITQTVLAALAFLLPDEHAHHGTGPAMLGADMAHLANESSAWNLALGVSFVVGAVWIRHLAGLLPALGCFALLLALVSALDLASGNVHAGRVVAHLLVLAGLGLIALIVTTPAPDRRPQPTRRGEDLPEPALEAEPVAAKFTLGKRRPDPAARHHAA